MSEQYGIDFANRDPVYEALHTIQQHHGEFRQNFHEWLVDNWHIWRAFEREARRIRDRGFAHYSALTILFYLRHHTALQEKPPAEFKINNNFAPDMGRLLMLTYPEFRDFFETRVRTAAA